MSILNDNTRVAVSSVLNRDVKTYGKKLMFDGDEDTCWNSDQGENQWIRIGFTEEMEYSSSLVLKVQFQGGFSSKVCSVSLLNANDTLSSIDCYPEDVNSIQFFDLNFNCKSLNYTALKIDFKNSTDFFGRITIYCLDILNTSQKNRS